MARSYSEEYKEEAVRAYDTLRQSSPKFMEGLTRHLQSIFPDITPPDSKLLWSWLKWGRDKGIIDDNSKNDHEFIGMSDESAAAEIRDLQQQLKDIKTENVILQRKADFVLQCKNAIHAYTSVAPPMTLKSPPPRGNLSPLTPVIVLGDWHYNESVVPERFADCRKDECPELLLRQNTYNIEIAERRVAEIFRKATIECLDIRQPERIERVIIAFLGDLNSGDIHDFPTTNCGPSMSAAVRLGGVIAEELLSFRKNIDFPEIDIFFNVGNHGRIQSAGQRKSVDAKRVTENYDWVTGEVAKTAIGEQPRMLIANGEALHTIRKIYDRTHLFYHGDCITGGLSLPGFPAYGAAKFYYQQLARYLSLHEEINYIHLQHFHSYIVMPFGTGFVFFGPSLIGMTERGASKGYSGSIAQSIRWCTPAHGVGAHYPLELEK